jgi:hypothetical protein
LTSEPRWIPQNGLERRSRAQARRRRRAVGRVADPTPALWRANVIGNAAKLTQIATDEETEDVPIKSAVAIDEVIISIILEIWK